MANDLNACHFTGRLGQDPEVRFLPSGQPVANLNLAVGKKWRDRQSGNMQEATSWMRCAAFGKTAELAQQYLKKGAQICVTCEARENKWTDQNGNNRSSMEFVIQSMKFLGGGPQQGNGQAPQGGYQQGQYGSPGPSGHPQQGGPQGQPGNPGGGYPQGGQAQGGPPPTNPPPQQGGAPQQGGNPGAPNTGGFDDFDDEIPFAPLHPMMGG